MGILFWILAGLIAGWLTGKIMKGSGYGFFGDILLGNGGVLSGKSSTQCLLRGM